jgi:sporulation inhibitor KapD
MQLDRPAIILDFEFSVLDVAVKKKGKLREFKTFEIIESGVYYYDQKKGFGFSFNHLVKPKFQQFKLDEKVIKLTGIIEDDLRENGVSMKRMHNELTKFYKPGETYIFTWGKNDMSVLKHACEKYQLSYPFLEEDCIDVSEEFHKTFLNENENTYSLEKAMEKLQIEQLVKHRAREDAISAYKILEQIIIEKQKINSFS